jgi:nucleoside-diphosphate-sugar epimerase
MVWGSGNQMRDFIHIDDCVRGVVETMDRIDDGSPLNLSTGIPTSFKTLAGIAAECAGYRPEVYGSSDKPEGVFARYGDTTVQREMGFVASTRLEDGIARAVAYFDAALQRSAA